MARRRSSMERPSRNWSSAAGPADACPAASSVARRMASATASESAPSRLADRAGPASGTTPARPLPAGLPESVMRLTVAALPADVSRRRAWGTSSLTARYMTASYIYVNLLSNDQGGHVTLTRTSFEIQSWDEQPYVEHDDGRKLTRAAVTRAFSGDLQGQG